MRISKLLAGLALGATMFATSTWASDLIINTDMSDPAPKKAFQEVIDGFKAANPDINVKWNEFDHEGYKNAIGNFLQADPPMWPPGTPATAWHRR